MGFEKAGTHSKPRLLGRLLRLGLGAVVLYAWVRPFLVSWDGFLKIREGWDTPGGNWWLAIPLVLFLLPHAVDGGLDFRLGNLSRYVFGGLLVAAGALNFVLYGSLWGPASAGFLAAASILVFGHLAISFVVKGVAATPG